MSKGRTWETGFSGRNLSVRKPRRSEARTDQRRVTQSARGARGALRVVNAAVGERHTR
jgi:hypothetical protein